MTIAFITLALASGAAPSLAATRSAFEHDERFTIEASSQDLGNAGTRRVVEGNYRLDRGGVTLLLSPALGNRRSDGDSHRAARLGADLYAGLSPALSSRTYVRGATASKVFARWEVGQDLTMGILPRTNLTIGARVARYQGGDRVTFASAGLRRYFPGGSFAYTLTAAKLHGEGTGIGHTFNAALNGRNGATTQLWLARSSAAEQLEWLDGDERGHVSSAVVRRVQPVARNLAMTARLGVARYDTPTNQKTGLLTGLGLEVRF